MTNQIDKVIEELKKLLENGVLFHAKIQWPMLEGHQKDVAQLVCSMPQILNELERLKQQESEAKKMVHIFEDSIDEKEQLQQQNQILMEAVRNIIGQTALSGETTWKQCAEYSEWIAQEALKKVSEG